LIGLSTQSLEPIDYHAVLTVHVDFSHFDGNQSTNRHLRGVVAAFEYLSDHVLI